MSEYVLSTEKLVKSYHRKNAVDGVDIHVKRGEIYGLIGRNGAGKSTFLKMAAGLANPTSGTITIFDRSNSKLKSVLTRVGVMIEEPGLFPGMSAYENMKCQCLIRNIGDRKYINDLLTLVGLGDVGKKPAGKFSLGMKQRLGIALALVGEPDIMLLDEPINGLDPQGIREVRELIRKLNEERNITFIISSHILDELARIATSYGFLANGKIIKEVTAAQIREECGESVIVRVEDTSNAVTVLDGMGIKDYSVTDSSTVVIDGMIDRRAEINKTLINKGVDVQELTIKRKTLEEYFLDLTGEE